MSQPCASGTPIAEAAVSPALAPTASLAPPAAAASARAAFDRRRLPLNSLRAFEAAARLMSFTRAAESLGVTQSAISRHVLNLEEGIGARLFGRRGSALALTRAGADLLSAVTPALDRMQAGLNAICGSERGGTLRLALPPSFAVRVAAPVLEACRAATGLSIEIDTLQALESLDTSPHDAAVVFSRPRVTDQVMDLLWMEELTLLCRPDLAARAAREGLAAALAGAGILHIRNEAGPRAAWEAFARGAGHAPATLSAPSLPQPLPLPHPLAQGLVFDTAHMALDFAAREGGFVVADRRLAARDLAEGRLVAPLPEAVAASGFGYFLLFRPEDLEREAVQVFRRQVLAAFAPPEVAPATAAPAAAGAAATG